MAGPWSTGAVGDLASILLSFSAVRPGRYAALAVHGGRVSAESVDKAYELTMNSASPFMVIKENMNAVYLAFARWAIPIAAAVEEVGARAALAAWVP